MHLVLINPLSRKSGIGANKNSNFPPLALSFIAAVTPEQYRISLIDENMEICSFPHADLVGITGYTSAINRGYQIATEYRKKGVPVIMGGIHVSMLPDEALQYCDCVVTGEAETVWPSVLKDFENGGLKRIYEGGFTNIEQLPLPRRDLLDPNYFWGTLQTSRGCPLACNFCSVTAFNGRRFRRRSMDDVISELQQIKQRLVYLIDDNIVLSQVDFDAERFDNEQQSNTSGQTVNVIRVAGGRPLGKEKLPLGDVRFKILIRGVAADAGDIADLICKLEESPYFCLVYPSFSRNRKIKAGPDKDLPVSEFEISCYLANYQEKQES